MVRSKRDCKLSLALARSSQVTDEFYTKNDKVPPYITFDISKIFDETSPEYIAMIKDIDYTAGLLKKFQDNHIPIIWRPLHEAAGGWFWWGAKGAAPCKKLWQVMFDRMVNYHGLHNLIWVWTHEPNDDAWHPGDEYVDIVGRDIYKTGDHTSQVLEFNYMTTRYGGKKMITISECGAMPDESNLIKDDAGWSWYMVWNDDFVRSSVNNSLDLWKKMFASDYVYTLDEMPNLKTYTTQSIIMEKINNLQVYPTYFDFSFNISSPEIIQTISIYSELGIRIKTINPKTAQTVVSLSGFPSGTYILKVDKQAAIKVIKR